MAEESKPALTGEASAEEYRNSEGYQMHIEGTRESLARCAKMLDTYAPDCFPANEVGQIHFARAMMESVADEIRAYLKANPKSSS